MKNLITFLMVIISFTSLSQIQNERGKLILEGQDTIVGLITYYDDISTNVIYTDNSDNSNSCTIDCINEIILDNGVRFTTIDYDDNDDGKVFVQKIITSDLISLYGSEENGTTYFYINKDTITYRLENNRLIEKNDKNIRYARYDRKYLGSLKMIMSDKPELFDRIDKLKLTEDDIMALVLDYNQGNVEYIMSTAIAKSKSISNWVAFAQYSHFGTYFQTQPTFDYSYGYFIGTQMYFSRSRRHSLKFLFGYSRYNTEKTIFFGHASQKQEYYYSNFISLGITYEYIFILTNRTHFYAQLQFGEIGYLTEFDKKTNTETETSRNFYPMPRLSPGIGFEYKTKKRLSFNLEINHLLNAAYIPENFSVGIKYDIGKVTRNRITKN